MSDNTARGLAKKALKQGEKIAGQVEEKTNKLSSQLIDADKSNNQVDFVKLLKDHNPISPVIKARILGDRRVEASIPLGGNKVARYTIEKDVLDDFMKFQDGSIATLGQNEAIWGYTAYTKTTGAWSKLANNHNHYTREVGATAEGTFTGTGLDMQVYFEGRGGLWEYKVDGIVVKTISTHSGAYAGVTSNLVPIVRGLPHKEHTWVATFKGDDPAHPSADGPNTSRGWMKSPSTITPTPTDKNTYALAVYTIGTVPLVDIPVLVNSSNKEFAFHCSLPSQREVGNFFPDHGTGTAFAGEQKVYFDDELITNWEPQYNVRDVKVVKVIQKMNMILPNQTSPQAEVFIVHTITAGGVSYKVNWKWLKETVINNGYVHMFPVYFPFVEKLRTSFNKTYLATSTDGSRTYLSAEGDKARSYAYFNETGDPKYRDVVAAMTVLDIKSSFRHHLPNRYSDLTSALVWLEHRDATMQKLYPHTYKAHTATVGEEYSFGATIFVGLLPYASELLK